MMCDYGKKRRWEGKNVKDIQKVSMTDAAVENIKENILTGVYAVGDKLPTEYQFCSMLHVSRTVVREALRVLTALGYVIIKPGKGAFVARRDEGILLPGALLNLTNITFHDVMEVRIPIEEISVRLAIKRANEAQINILQEIHASLLEANQKGNSARVFMIDELFHATIAEACGNPLLVNINRQLSKAFMKYRGSSALNDKTYCSVIELHEQILNAFENRDAAAGVVAMHEHLLKTMRDIDFLLVR